MNECGVWNERRCGVSGICMGLARVSVGGERDELIRGLDLGLTNPLGTCLGLCGEGGVGWGLGAGSGRVVLCLCEL